MDDHFPTFRAIAKELRELRPRIRRGIKVARRIIKVTFKIVLALLVLFFLVHTVFLIICTRSLNHTLSEMRAQGKLYDISDLAPKPVAESENAALVYERANQKLKELYQKHQSEMSGDCVSISVHPTSFMTSKDSIKAESDARSFIPKTQPVFELIEQAAAHPKCVFPVKWQDGGNALLSHINKVRQLTTPVLCRAKISAKDGRIDESVDDICLALRISGALEKDPCLASLTTRTSLVFTSLTKAQKAYSDKLLSNEQAKRIYDEISRIDLGPQFDLAVKAEQSEAGWWFAEARKEGGPLWYLWDDGSDSTGTEKMLCSAMGYLWLPVVCKDQEAFLKTYAKCVEMSKLPYRLIVKRRPWDYHKKFPRYALISKLIFIDPSSPTLQRDKTLAQMGLAQTGMALRSYKNNFGTYPSSLNELKNKIEWKLPYDPFSGKPFKYRKSGDGFVLYSLGENLKDDGGKVSYVGGPEVISQQKSDQVWIALK